MHWFVNVIVEDCPVIESHSHHPLAKTLRLAWELLGGIPQAECCIRRNGHLMAWLHTNWKGELDEVEIYSPRSSLVTPMNPAFRLFQGVFA